jgi:5-methylcytosine-specific restriction protein A
MTQEEYIDYLRYVYVKADGNKLADSSVIHYGVNAINSINERLQSIFGPEFSIYEIDDIEVLSSIRKKLFSEPDFVTSNKKGNQMYSAGMNRYFEYASGLMFRGKKDILPSLDKPIKLVDRPMAANEPKTRTINTPDRNRIKIIQCEQAYNYTCQIDVKHETFIVNKTSHQYMEGHHLIPLNKQSCFINSLDCFANILVVCPTCHRFLHYAEKTKREDKLKELYDERANRLENSGIDVDLKQFLELADSRPSGTVYSF